jgi:hypothetical protein
VTELYPTDNEWGVPLLRLDMQAKIVTPVLRWGSRSRGAVMTGTYVFYVEDSRFTALAKRPDQLLPTRCAGAGELNFTLFEQTPAAEVLWATYRKRLVARQWQDAGVPVMVDLNVPDRHRELCLLGVPNGWHSFATRGYAARPEVLRAEWGRARESGGEATTLLVFGGGPKIEAMCRELPGAVYAPSHWEEQRGAGATRREVKLRS